MREARRPKQKKIQRQQSYERVLDAALDLFVTHGYHAASVGQIAEAASLTKGAIYFHFENKAAVLLALLDMVERNFVDPLDRRVRRAGPDAKDKFVAFAHQQSELGIDNTKLAILAIMASSEFGLDDVRFGPRIRQIYRRLYDIVEDIIDLGKARGEFRVDVNTQHMASYVLATHDGTFLEWHRRGLDLSPKEITLAYRSMTLDALIGHPEQRSRR